MLADVLESGVSLYDPLPQKEDVEEDDERGDFKSFVEEDLGSIGLKGDIIKPEVTEQIWSVLWRGKRHTTGAKTGGPNFHHLPRYNTEAFAEAPCSTTTLVMCACAPVFRTSYSCVNTSLGVLLLVSGVKQEKKGTRQGARRVGSSTRTGPSSSSYCVKSSVVVTRRLPRFRVSMIYSKLFTKKGSAFHQQQILQPHTAFQLGMLFSSSVSEATMPLVVALASIVIKYWPTASL